MQFQSTQPEWAATGYTGLCYCQCQNFNPRSPSGLRLDDFLEAVKRKEFQSTQPEWAATTRMAWSKVPYTFQSTQPEWAATIFQTTYVGGRMISIHAARVGCDFILRCAVRFINISIHAARVGCDKLALSQKFARANNFNPRSPSGLRLQTLLFLPISDNISIHAARVGCDGTCAQHANSSFRFQSTQPEWAATLHPAVDVPSNTNFNPRSPSGLRQQFSFFTSI